MQIEEESDERRMQVMHDGLKDEDFIWTISRNTPRIFLKC